MDDLISKRALLRHLDKVVRVLNNYTKERYQSVLESHEKWGGWGIADGKYADNVIDLTALGIRERIDLGECYFPKIQ